MNCWPTPATLRSAFALTVWCLAFHYSAVLCAVAQERNAEEGRSAVAVDQYGPVVETNLCEILLAPETFNGRMVRVRGVAYGFIEGNLLLDTSCKNREPLRTGGSLPVRVWLEFRDDPKANRLTIKIREDKEYKSFIRLLFAEETEEKGRVCLWGCRRYIVTATIVGRFDHITPSEAPSHFGTGAWQSQLVLESVSDVVTRPSDSTLLFEEPAPLQEAQPSTRK